MVEYTLVIDELFFQGERNAILDEKKIIVELTKKAEHQSFAESAIDQAYEYLKKVASKFKSFYHYARDSKLFKQLGKSLEAFAKNFKKFAEKIGLGKVWNFLEAQVRSIVQKISQLSPKAKIVLSSIVLLVTASLVTYFVIRRKKQEEKTLVPKDSYLIAYKLYKFVDYVETGSQTPHELEALIDNRGRRQPRNRLPKTVQAIIDFIKDTWKQAVQEMSKIIGKILAFLIVAPLVFALAYIVAAIMCTEKLQGTTIAKVYLTALQTVYRNLKIVEPKDINEFCSSVFKTNG